MSRRRYTWNAYKESINKCSNPECDSYDVLESHHIIPIVSGGSDTIDNIIILCHKCHHSGKYHTDWMVHYDELHEWKTYIENKNHSIVKDKSKDVVELANNYDIGMVPWQETGLQATCEECDKMGVVYKFGNGFYCLNCINSYIQSQPEYQRDDLLSSGVPEYYSTAKKLKVDNIKGYKGFKKMMDLLHSS